MRFERAARAGVGEDDRAERRAVERAVGVERSPAPKRATTASKPGGARRDGLARQRVGVDRRRAERGERAQAVRLAGRDAAGQRDAQESRSVTGSAGARLRAGISASVSVAGVIRSSTNVFHSWQCGHCQSSSVLRYRQRMQTCGSR